MLILGYTIYFVAAVICYCNMYAAHEDVSPRFKSQYDRSKSRLENLREKYRELADILHLDFFYPVRMTFWIRQMVAFAIAPLWMLALIVFHKLGWALRWFVEQPWTQRRKPPPKYKSW